MITNSEKKMRFARKVRTDTKGETIFNEFVTYFKESNTPLKNIITCATNDDPFMIGRYT